MADPVHKQRLTDRKRSAILAAAISEFQRNGFDGTSMDTVAETAEVSKRTVYNHFKSKDALFAAIIAEVRTKIVGIDEMPYDAAEDLEAQLIAIAHSIARATMSQEFISLARVVISRFMQAPEFAAKTMKEQDEFNQSLVGWIKAATSDGRLKVKDAEHASTEFIALIKAFAFWPQLIGTAAPLPQRELDEVIRSSAAMFLSKYAPSS